MIINDKKHVVVQPYNEAWLQNFTDIKAEIQGALGELALEIEHVGSTSVQGLSAKPIIDIDVVIKDESVLGDVILALQQIGYRHAGNLGIVGREAFKYDGKEHLQKHHLYVCPQDSEELKRHKAFRDYLRSHPEAVREYGHIKEEGAKLYPYDMEKYIEHKSPFIERIYNTIQRTQSVPSTNIILEQLTHENFRYACGINRDDIPEEWVDTAVTIMDINDYGVENNLIGHTFLARINDKYIGLIMIGEALPWDTDPIEMKGTPFYRLMGFVVDKEYRNRGLGGEIMESAIEQVYQEFGRRSLALGVHKDNTQAGKFYERHGFKKTGVFEGDDEYYLRLI